MKLYLTLLLGPESTARQVIDSRGEPAIILLNEHSTGLSLCPETNAVHHPSFVAESYQNNEPQLAKLQMKTLLDAQTYMRHVYQIPSSQVLEIILEKGHQECKS